MEAVNAVVPRDTLLLLSHLASYIAQISALFPDAELELPSKIQLLFSHVGSSLPSTMAHCMNTPAQMVLFYNFLMVLCIASATSQLVGCGTLKCDCEIENRTLSALGQASFTSSYIENGTMPLTWTLGLQETQDPDHRSKVLIEQSFYLGLPQNVSLSNTTVFGACALFFTDMTSLLKFKFTDPEHGTCQDVMGTNCVRDLISLAEQYASPDSSMSKDRTLDTEGFCRDLAVALYTHNPKSCPLWLGRSQESIHVDGTSS
jgi:hypothetical protein